MEGKFGDVLATHLTASCATEETNSHREKERCQCGPRQQLFSSPTSYRNVAETSRRPPENKAKGSRPKVGRTHTVEHRSYISNSIGFADRNKTTTRGRKRKLIDGKKVSDDAFRCSGTISLQIPACAGSRLGITIEHAPGDNGENKKNKIFEKEMRLLRHVWGFLLRCQGEKSAWAAYQTLEKKKEKRGGSKQVKKSHLDVYRSGKEAGAATSSLEDGPTQEGLMYLRGKNRGKFG